MSSKNLVICDRETEYAARLADYLSGKKELALQVKLCSSAKQLQKIRREEAVDVLLTEEGIVFAEEELTGISKVICLSADGSGDFESPIRTIFRYQSGDEIYTRLIEALAESGMGEFWNIRKKGRGNLIGFYSPVHRLGQTSFALKKGAEMAKSENVLYMNLEPCAGIGGYFPEEKRNLSMLLYYAKQESGNPGLLITTLVKQMGELDYIPPLIFPEDLKTVTVSEWMWLFGEILNHSIYDVLILDLSDAVQGLFEILKACDCVYMPTADDPLAAAKIYQYEEALCRQGYGEVWERMIRCDIRRTAKDKDFGTA